MGRKKLTDGSKKDTYIKVVCNKEFKDTLRSFCEKHDLKMADFARNAIEEKIQKYKSTK